MRGGNGSTNCLIRIFARLRINAKTSLPARNSLRAGALQPANSEPRELVSLGFSGFDSIIRGNR